MYLDLKRNSGLSTIYKILPKAILPVLVYYGLIFGSKNLEGKETWDIS